jgi:DNA invertase Pin-like site-specific DNA recombinase
MGDGLHEFAELGVEFVSLKDSGIDMTTPSGKLLLHILAAFAEFEASIIRMRVKAGLEAAEAKGKRLLVDPSSGTTPKSNCFVIRDAPLGELPESLASRRAQFKRRLSDQCIQIPPPKWTC